MASRRNFPAFPKGPENQWPLGRGFGLAFVISAAVWVIALALIL